MSKRRGFFSEAVQRQSQEIRITDTHVGQQSAVLAIWFKKDRTNYRSLEITQKKYLDKILVRGWFKDIKKNVYLTTLATRATTTNTSKI